MEHKGAGKPAKKPNVCSMENEWQRRRRRWIAYLHVRHRWDEEQREEARKYPDGMCHGIIPLGAITEALRREALRLREAVARPAPAWGLAADESGVTLGVQCPYCQEEHQHVVDQGTWDPEAWWEAPCGEGMYRIGCGEGA